MENGEGKMMKKEKFLNGNKNPDAERNGGEKNKMRGKRRR